MTSINSTRVKAPEFLSSALPQTHHESNDEPFLKSSAFAQERKASECGAVEDNVNGSSSSLEMLLRSGQKKKRVEKKRRTQVKPFQARLKECRVVCERIEDVNRSLVGMGESQVGSDSPSQMSEFCEHCGLTFISRDDLNLHVPVCREKLWVHDVSLHAPDDFDFLDESEASASRLSEQ